MKVIIIFRVFGNLTTLQAHNFAKDALKVRVYKFRKFSMEYYRR